MADGMVREIYTTSRGHLWTRQTYFNKLPLRYACRDGWLGLIYLLPHFLAWRHIR
jgi:hypothetical protein